MKQKKKLKCRLIISDFDGTLANSDNQVDEKNKKAIAQYVEDGGIFVVCTGRILPSVLPRVREMGLKGLVAASQGSVIADIQSGKILREVTMSARESALVSKTLEELGARVHAYTGEGFYADCPAEDEFLKRYERITGVCAGHARIPLSEYLLTNGVKCQKFATLCYPEDQERLYREIKSRLGERFTVTCSANVLVEICPKGENKGEALKYFCRRYSIPQEETCAVGDNLNDWEMLQAAGYGVAVANCSPDLRALAKYFTSSNDKNAVAKVIEDYGYENDD